MPRHKGFMGRSDIPFAQRLKLQRQAEIVAYREETARVTMFCNENENPVTAKKAKMEGFNDQ